MPHCLFPQIKKSQPDKTIRWFAPGTRLADRAGDFRPTGARLATDGRGQLVILFPSEWALGYYAEKQPNVALHSTSPHAQG